MLIYKQNEISKSIIKNVSDDGLKSNFTINKSILNNNKEIASFINDIFNMFIIYRFSYFDEHRYRIYTQLYLIKNIKYTWLENIYKFEITFSESIKEHITNY